jgi:hypothetical protein
MRPLIIPPAAQRDPESIQMISAWIADQSLHCSLNIGLFEAHGSDEPQAWGVMLADLIRHIARAHQDEFGSEREDTVASILATVELRLNEPEPDADGSFHPGHD